VRRAGPAVVRSDPRSSRRVVLCGIGWSGHAGQGFQQPGRPRCAAGNLCAPVLAHLLACRDTGGPRRPAVWSARREPGAKFLLAWAVPSWIVFELIVTKLPHYVLPTYPAIAILLAGIVDARMLSSAVTLVRGTM